MLSYLNSLELEHHGVKGMKWGVRRYQNLDGTLTAAGKKRKDKLQKKVLSNLNYTFNRINVSKKDRKRAIRNVMNMSLQELEIRSMSPYDRAIFETKGTEKASKLAIRSERYQNKGNISKANKYMERARNVWDKTYPNLAKVSWDDVEKVKNFEEIYKTLFPSKRR